MTLYKATKNLIFSSLGKNVIIDETIELEDEYAEQVNKDLKLTFPDVDAVLVPVDEETSAPKKSGRKKAVKTEQVEETAD